jgi:hypothetical protein
MVGWLRDRAEGGARRRRLWGSRWELCSDEPATQAGQQANVEASGRSRARARSVHWLGEQVGGKARRRAFNGARRSTARSRESDLPSFYRQPGHTKAMAWALSRHTVTAWAPHGPVVRRATARTQYGGAAIGGATARSACLSHECGTRGDGGLGVCVGAEALGPAVTVRYRRACPVGRRRGLA